MSLQYHPFADLFPMILGEARVAFVASIRANDILEKIVMHDGQILDGRNRYEAGIEAGLFDADVAWQDDPHFVTFDSLDTGMPALDWVLLKNLDGRRHLTESQRAMIGHKLEGFAHGGARRGVQDANLHVETSGDDAADTTVSAREPEAETPVETTPAPVMDRKAAAEAMHVSERSIASAAKVTTKGAPELQQAVNAGDVSVSVAADLATLPVDKQLEVLKAANPRAISDLVADIRAKRQADKRAKRAAREQELGRKQLAIGGRKAVVLYIDPDWKYLTHSENGQDRAAENHYPTSRLIEIMMRPVGKMAADDAVIFMWATVPMLIEAICVLDAYGFVRINRDPVTGFLMPDKSQCQYVSHQAWIKQDAAGKPHNGMGFWFRNGHEILLVAKRGNVPAPAMGTQPNSVLESRRGAHSAKPVEPEEMIETWYPTVPKLELHRRGKPRPGWWAWGNEVEADPENGVTVDENGFADASHLPLLTASTSNEISSSAPSGGDNASPATSLDGGVSGRGGPDEGDAAGSASGPAASPTVLPGWDAETRNLEARWQAWGDGLPKSQKKLAEAFTDAMRAYDAAMCSGAADGARSAGERMGAVLYKANGDTIFALDTAKAPMAIRKAAAAALGDMPMWGQNGCFLFKGKQLTAIVETTWPNLKFYAASDAPFFSETGFRSVHSRIDGLGLSVADYLDAVIAEVLDEKGAGLVAPQTIYRIGRVGPVPVHTGDKS